MSRVADQSLGILVQRECLFCALDLSFRNLNPFEASADWIRHEQIMDFTIVTQELIIQKKMLFALGFMLNISFLAQIFISSKNK